MRSVWSVLAVAVVATVACSNNTTLNTTSFATPIGLVVAGSETKYLFVSNADEDTLQIVTLPDQLSSTDFVRGPNLYFPLRIPAGSRPTQLAASRDGRYVIVLDAATNSLSLIDADAFTKATDLLGNPVEIALTQRGAIPTDMVALPASADCGGCAARVFVSLAASGSVLAIDLKVTRDAENNVVAGPTFEAVQAYDVGGEPRRLAVSPDGQYLYVTDNQSTTVARIRLAVGVGGVERRDIGGIGGPVAVSQDNTMLLVGRPLSRDVVVMEGANDASWAVFDANALYAPQPRCLRDCASGQIHIPDGDPDTPDDFVCLEPQLPDLEICVDDSGLRLDGPQRYTAIYVENVPTLITTLGANAGNPPLVYSCTDGDVDLNNDGDISDEEDDRDSSIAVSYGEYALVITEGDRAIGDIFWMPLRSAVGAPATPQLASASCGRPALDIDVQLVENGGDVDDFGPYQISNYMAPCVNIPDRQRFACAQDAGGGGLVVLAGNVPVIANQSSGPLARRARWDFIWEGVLDNLDRSNGGGELFLATDEVTATNEFTDVGLFAEDYAQVRIGDRLEILSSPSTLTECVEALGGDTRTCTFERKITNVASTDDGRVRLTFDGAAIPTACFLRQGRIAYRIRAGDQFIVSRSGVEPWRMSLDQRFGPGGDVARDEPIIFELRQDLLTNDSTGSACDRYDDDGAVLPTSAQNPLLSRAVRFAVIVVDAFRPYMTGRAYASSGSTLGSAGSIPGDVTVYQPPLGENDTQQNPKVYITYSAADTLVGMDPTNADDASRGVTETQFILRN